jgi:hypothetical protein
MIVTRHNVDTTGGLCYCGVRGVHMVDADELIESWQRYARRLRALADGYRQRHDALRAECYVCLCSAGVPEVVAQERIRERARIVSALRASAKVHSKRGKAEAKRALEDEADKIEMGEL